MENPKTTAKKST